MAAATRAHRAAWINSGTRTSWQGNVRWKKGQRRRPRGAGTPLPLAETTWASKVMPMITAAIMQGKIRQHWSSRRLGENRAVATHLQ